MFQKICTFSCFFILFFCVFVSCKNAATSTGAMDNKSLPYQLQKPNSTFKLPKILQEISGITVYKDKSLAAVQDEKGILFILNIEDGSIVDTVNFSADGDYEDIVSVGEYLYAIRSDGVLFRITDWQDKDKIQTKVIDTNLGEINNTEGLTYLPDSNDLLIICKGSAAIGKKEHKSRAVYRFDLDSMKFDVNPFFSINRKQFKQYVKDSLKGYEEYDLFRKEMKNANKQMPIQPSAIAIHPIEKEIYILAAVGNALLVLHPDYSIKSCHYLSTKMFEQPEGIAFDSKGNLFISSESKNKKAKIHRFDYLAQ